LISLLVSATAAASRPDRFRRPLTAAVRDTPLHLLPEAAELHRVAGTVRRGLVGIDDVPDQVLIELDGIRQASSLRHLVTMGALGQVGRAFDDAGLAWVVMKGPVLASHLYVESVPLYVATIPWGPPFQPVVTEALFELVRGERRGEQA